MKADEDFHESFQQELHSRWTVEQLRELIREVNEERDRRYSDRFEGLEKAMAAGFAAAKEAVAAALAAAKEALTAAFGAAKEAITKQEMATEKRFEGVNEFRNQLKDQQQTFVSKAEATTKFDDFSRRVTELERIANREAGGAAGTSRARTRLDVQLQLWIPVFIALAALAIALFRQH